MVEGLVSLIAKHRSAIVSKWFDSAVQAYAPDTAAFLNSQKDPFANPVGSNTRQGIEGLLDQLLGDMDAVAVSRCLDSIMRIRAVQTPSPAQATAFLFQLKEILRGLFDKELQAAGMVRQFLEFEARIDRIALAAFDIYMACREQVYELKANETRNRTFRAFERAGLIAKAPEKKPEPDAG